MRVGDKRDGPVTRGFSNRCRVGISRLDGLAAVEMAQGTPGEMAGMIMQRGRLNHLGAAQGQGQEEYR